MGFCTLYSVENVDDVMNYYDENLIKADWNRGISNKNLNLIYQERALNCTMIIKVITL